MLDNETHESSQFYNRLSTKSMNCMLWDCWLGTLARYLNPLLNQSLQHECKSVAEQPIKQQLFFLQFRNK